MRIFSYTQIAQTALPLIQSPQSLAQKSDEEELSAIYGDRSTISNTTGNSQALLRAPVLATVTSAEDIAASGAYTFDAVLETVPSLPANCQAQVDSPLNSTRGLASALYGTNGHASAINIFTKVLFRGTKLPAGQLPDGVIDRPSHWQRQLWLSAFANYSGFKSLQIRQPHISPTRHKLNYIHIQDEWEITKDLALTAGFRHDRYSDFGRTNMIATIANPAPTSCATDQNLGKQSGKGLELALAWEVSRSFRVLGNNANQKTTDNSNDKGFGYAPHHHLYGRADWRFANGWPLSSKVSWMQDYRERAGGW